MVISPHEPDCAVLTKIVSTEQRGICYQCGSKKKKLSGFDNHMGMVATKTWCPKGHSTEMDWKPVTPKDVKKFGLVRKKKSREL